ncbi:MAG: HlyD family efflux transporter periplasmic adaptor subunit, partial [Rubripirellula sp.]|nr:HlyD family efflux transporter periplasmic adaptor subunit [Rubripirellula sp.]
HAPAAGQVVYANERQRGEPVVIEEGSQIRFNQMVARLPDIKKMQVDVKINESHINRVSPGMQAEITLDADPEKLLFGKVKRVAPYPFPMRWHGAPLEYGVEVAIKDPPKTIRPGLRAKVKIFFEAETSVLQIPLAAVIAHEKSHYCLIRDGDGWRPTPITIGPNNNNQVVVTEGITEGDQVALTPFRFIQRSDLPTATKAAVNDQDANRNNTQFAKPPQPPNQTDKEFTATEIGTAQADAGT